MADEGRRKGKQKSASGRTSADKDTARNRTILEASIRSQVAAEEQAHHIVENLVLEKCIHDENYFLEIGNYITPSHYSDITEERAIANVCGYPLCSNTLTQVPKQKYKISVKTNRVFDITERKHYCSNYCYKASKYFESQIPTSPVWTRIGESPKKFTLLSATDSSFKPSPGEVLIGTDKLANEEIRKESESTRANATSVNNATNSTENNSSETLKNTVPETKNSEDIKHSTVESNKEHGDTRADVTNKLNQLAISPSTDSVKDNNVNEKEHCEGVINDTDLRLSSQKEKNEEISDKKADRSSLQKTQEMRTKTVLQRETLETNTKEMFLRSIRETLMQWFTDSTYGYFKMTVIRNHDDLEDDSSCKDNPEQNEMSSFTDRALRFLKTTKKQHDGDVDGDGKQQTQLTKSQLTSKNIKITEKNTKIDEGYPCVVPPIDSKSQLTLKRQILIQKLMEVVPEVLSKTTYNTSEVATHFSALVKTFRLDRQHTMFKPLQWKVLATALVYLLEQNLDLKRDGSPSDVDYREKILTHLGLTIEDMNHIIDSLPTRHDKKTKDTTDTTASSPPKDIKQGQPESYSLMEDLD